MKPGDTAGRRPLTGIVGARTLFAKGSVYSAATAAQALASLLILPWLTRRLAVDVYGVIAVSLVVGQVVAVVGAMGLPAAVTRSFLQGDSGAPDSRTVIMLAALAAAVTALVGHVFGPAWVQLFGSVQYGTTLQLALAWGCMTAFATSVQAQLQARGRAARFLVIVLVQNVGGHALGAVLVTVSGEPASYIAGLLAMGAASATIGLVFTMRGGISRATADFVRRTAAISLPFVPHALALYVLAMGDRIVVERLLGLEMVGRYHAAYVAGNVALVGLLAVNNAWSPIVLRAPEGQRWEVLAGTTAVLERLTALGVGALALAAPSLAVVLVPQSYGPATLHPVIVVTAASALPMVAYLAAGHALLSEGKTLSIGFITPAVAVLNIALNFALVPAFGLAGAASATLLCYSAQAIGVGMVASRFAVIPWQWRQRSISWTLLAAVACLAFVLPTTGAWTWGRVGGALGLAVTAAVVLARAVSGHAPVPGARHKTHRGTRGR